MWEHKEVFVGRTDDELDLWEDFAMVNLLTNPVSPDTTGVKLLPVLNNST